MGVDDNRPRLPADLEAAGFGALFRYTVEVELEIGGTGGEPTELMTLPFRDIQAPTRFDAAMRVLRQLDELHAAGAVFVLRGFEIFDAPEGEAPGDRVPGDDALGDDAPDDGVVPV